eukprot:4369520-Pyramimonas_sp.AAC.1
MALGRSARAAQGVLLVERPLLLASGAARATKGSQLRSLALRGARSASHSPRRMKRLMNQLRPCTPTPTQK